jgi:hypothetical protein
MSAWGFRFLELVILVAVVTLLLISWRADRRDRAQLTTQLAAAQQALNAADTRQRDRDTHLSQTLATIAAQKRAADSASPQQLLAALQRQFGLPAPPTVQSNRATAENRVASQDSARSAATVETAQQGSSHSGKGTDAQQSPAANSSEINQFAEGEGQTGRSSITGNADNGRGTTARARPTSAQASPEPNPQITLPAQDLKPLYNFTLDCQACQAKLAGAQGDLADERAKSAALTRERDAALQAAKGGTLWRRITRAAKWFAIGAAAGTLAAKSTH